MKMASQFLAFSRIFEKLYSDAKQKPWVEMGCRNFGMGIFWGSYTTKNKGDFHSPPPHSKQAVSIFFSKNL